MNDTASFLIEPAAVAAAMIAGIALGIAYFLLLRRSTEALVAGRAWRFAAALSVVRVAGAVVVLGMAARFGAMPLLSVFAGFLVARTIVLRQGRKGAG